MERIIDKRSTGKTRKLLEYAQANGANVVCANPNAMRRKAEAYGIYGLNFYTYSNFWADIVPGPIVIDEWESCMTDYEPGYLIGYTISNED